RWNAVISRLRPLTAAGESSQASRHDRAESPRPEAVRMNAGERRLVSLAAALIAESTPLSVGEGNLVASAAPGDAARTTDLMAQIRAGHDVLGTAFCGLMSARQRRRHGATYTPGPIVNAMVEWAGVEIPAPARVVDPGAGSGRFLIAAARKFPDAELVA